MKSPPWRFIQEGPCDGLYNMAVDATLLKLCNQGASPPTFRLYGWSGPTLSIGHNQSIENEIDLDQCRKLGIPVIRRPTGGRALLHDREICYSLTAPIPFPGLPGDLRGTLKEIGRMLVLGLQKLGVDNPGVCTGDKPERSFGHDPSCFSSANHWEVSVSGKKLVGSAQRRMKHAFMQHGSIPLTLHREWAEKLFKYRTQDLKMRSLQKLNSSATCLNEVLGFTPSLDKVSFALDQGFQDYFSVKLQPGSFREPEIRQINLWLDSATVQTPHSQAKLQGER